MNDIVLTTDSIAFFFIGFSMRLVLEVTVAITKLLVTSINAIERRIDRSFSNGRKS